MRTADGSKYTVSDHYPITGLLLVSQDFLVVDDYGRVSEGINLDLIRNSTKVYSFQRDYIAMNVRDIMTSEVATCTPDTSLEQVAKMMVSNDCGEIPVTEKMSQKLVGVVTDRDIVVRAVAKGADPRNMTVSDCMSSPAVSVKPDTTIEDCLDLMESKQIRRVPVVDRDGICCGIVSQADVARKASPRRTAEVVREISEN